MASKTPQLSRRDMLKLSAAGVMAGTSSGWFDVLASRAADVRAEGGKHKSCILLFMTGGPAQSLTFDLKSTSQFKPISTSVPGIQISEKLPHVAKQMQHMALVRGMSTGEASHIRAKYLMHTGFRSGFGGLVFPSMGAVVAQEIGNDKSDLPNFVAVGSTFGSGFLGPKVAPVIITEASRGIENLKPSSQAAEVDARAAMVDRMDQRLLDRYQATPIEAHKKGYEQALKLMHSARAKAFDVTQEPEAMQKGYGNTSFGKSCLMARRLVEAGVPFVEVGWGNWDTHSKAVERHVPLLGELDQPYAFLLQDLHQRNLLKDTLVIWMGEFGRSPGSATNHYAKAWTSVFSGAGLKTGQAIGKTDESGGTVADRPVNVKDFMATVYKALGIDYTKKVRLKGGRPVPLVDTGAKPVEQLF